MQTSAVGAPAVDEPAAASGGDPAGTPVDAVLHSLISVGRLMRQRIHADHFEPGTFWLLKHLHARGALRVTELASLVGLDTSTVSRHVTQLERAGMVERTRDPLDRRAQQVELSPHGREEFAGALLRRRGLLIQTFSQWDEADIRTFDRLLRQLVSDIDRLNPEENA